MKLQIEIESEVLERAWSKMKDEQERDPNCVCAEFETLIENLFDHAMTYGKIVSTI